MDKITITSKMKNPLPVFLLAIGIFLGKPVLGQEIVNLYKKLSIELTELDLQQKDSLLNNGSYVAPDSDSLMTIVYKIDIIDTVNNYLKIYYEYTTGQAGWASFEYRLFKSETKKLLVVSLTGGVRVSHHQNDFKIYEVNKTNSLTEIKLPWTINHSEFFKKNTPKKYLDENKEIFCFNYELSPGEFPNGIGYSTGLCYMIDPEVERFQVKDVIKINWTGQMFKKEMIFPAKK